MAGKDKTPDDDRPDGKGPDDEALLDYVSGRLSPDAAAGIEAAAAADPDLAAEIVLMRGMRDVLQDQGVEGAPGELGWKRLERAMDAIEQDRPRTQTPLQRRAMLQVAAVAAVAAVVSWQFVALPLINGPQDGFGTASEDPVAGFTLTVAFAPDATEARIRALLAETGGRVVDGPGALGLWQISHDSAEARDAARAAFAAAPELVEHVQVN